MTFEEAKKVAELFGNSGHGRDCSYCAYDFAEAAERQFPEFVWVWKDNPRGPGCYVDVQEKVT